MGTKIFVIGFPTIEIIVGTIEDKMEDLFEAPKYSKPSLTCDFGDDDDDELDVKDLTPKYLRIKKPCGNVNPWGIGGKEADENLRFGAEFAVDEPRRRDYVDRDEFEYDHALYDEFVSAGEDCIERGLGRPSDVTAHRCNAVRKPIGCPPPMKDELPSELIGETDWWDENIDWKF